MYLSGQTGLKFLLQHDGIELSPNISQNAQDEEPLDELELLEEELLEEELLEEELLEEELLEGFVLVVHVGFASVHLKSEQHTKVFPKHPIVPLQEGV